MIPEDAIWILELIRNRDARTEAEKDAVNAAIEALKAQLSQEGKTKGATPDMISRTETVERLLGVIEITVPITDYDEGFIDGVNFGISTVSTMPSAQPVATDTNVGDTISRQWLMECVNEGWIKFDTEKDENRFIHLVRDIAPSTQPEPQWIPVSERLPEDRKSVIVCYRYWLQFSQKFAYAIVIGWHASKFGVKAEVFTDWDGDFDYNKEQDENYIPEGWYEFTTQGNGDLMNWYIDAEVIAWMPLPEPYKPTNKIKGERT